MKFNNFKIKFTNHFHIIEVMEIEDYERKTLNQQAVNPNSDYVVAFDEANDAEIKKIDEQLKAAKLAKDKVEAQIAAGLGGATVGNGLWAGVPILGAPYRETELGKLQNDATKLGTYQQLQGKLAEIEASLIKERKDYIVARTAKVDENKTTGLGADIKGQYDLLTKGVDKEIAQIQAGAQKYVEEYRSQFQLLNTITQGNLAIVQANVTGLNQRLGGMEAIAGKFTYDAKTNARTASSKKALEHHIDYDEAMVGKWNLRVISNIEALGKGLGGQATQVGKSASDDWDKYYADHKDEINKKAKALTDKLSKAGQVVPGLESADDVVLMFKSKHVANAVDDFVNKSGIKDYHEVSGVITNKDGSVKKFLKPKDPKAPNSSENTFFFGEKIDESQEIVKSFEVIGKDGKLKVKAQLKNGQIIDDVNPKDVLYQLSMSASGIANDSSKYMYMNFYTIDADKGYFDLKVESISNRLKNTGKGLLAGASKLFEEDENDPEEVKKLKKKYAGLSSTEKERKLDLLTRGMEQLYEGGGMLGINIGGLIKMFFSGELFEFFKLQKDVKAMNKTMIHDNSSAQEDKKVDENQAKAREIILDQTLVTTDIKNPKIQVTKEQAEELFKLYEGSKSLANNYPSFSAFMLDTFADDKNNPLKFNNDQILAISSVVERAKITGATTELSSKTQTDLQAKSPVESLGIQVGSKFTPLEPEQIQVLDKTADAIIISKNSPESERLNQATLNNPLPILDSKANLEAALSNNFVTMVKDGKITKNEVAEFSDLVGLAVNKTNYPAVDLDKNPNKTSLEEVQAGEKEARRKALLKLGFDTSTIDGIIQNPNTSTDVMVSVLAAKYGFDAKDKDLLLKTMKGVSGGATATSIDLSSLPDDEQKGFSKMIKSVLYH